MLVVKVNCWNICYFASKLIVCYSPVVDEDRRLERENIKRAVDLINCSDEQSLSRNKLKKLRRYCNKSFVPKGDKFVKCHNCGNPKVWICFSFCELDLWNHCYCCCMLNVTNNFSLEDAGFFGPGPLENTRLKPPKKVKWGVLERYMWHWIIGWL